MGQTEAERLKTQERRFKDRARLADLVAARLNWARPAVLITGFWRSGTTWLQETLAEALQAKTIFEPLSPMVRRYDTLIGGLGLSSPAARHAYIPCLDADAPGERGLWRYLDEAFRGHCPDNAALICRKKLGESLRRRTVIKCVRMQFSLGAVQARYQAPVIHLRRNPQAVIASLLKARWDWSFAEVSLREVLEPHQGRLHDMVGENAVEECLRAHDQDPVSRIAAYWSLTETAAEAQLRRAGQGVVAQYETLLADPEARIRELADAMRLDLRSPVRWERDSPVTAPASVGAGRETRANAWRQVLSERDAARVLATVEAVRGAAT